MALRRGPALVTVAVGLAAALGYAFLAARSGQQAGHEEKQAAGGAPNSSGEVAEAGEPEASGVQSDDAHAPEEPVDAGVAAIPDLLAEELADELLEDLRQKAFPQPQRPETELERTKREFAEVMAEPRKGSLGMLARDTAGDEARAWLRGELVSRIESDPDPLVRRACLVGVWAFPDIAPATLGRALASDPDRGVRKVAAYCLGRPGAGEQVEVLLEAVRTDRGAPGHGKDLALVCISSLGAIGGERAARALRTIWESEGLSEDHRRATLAARGGAGDASALETLEETLASDDEHWRGTAIAGLGRLARSDGADRHVVARVMAALRGHVDDSSHRVRRQVAYQLSLLTFALIG
jgi:hypothetical protein